MGKDQWMNVLVSSHTADALTLLPVIYSKMMGAELSWLNGLMGVLLSVTYNTCSRTRTGSDQGQITQMLYKNVACCFAWFHSGGEVMFWSMLI